jgi:hypothetical protein
MPNQEGLSSTSIFTATAPGGTPPPASASNPTIQTVTGGQSLAQMAVNTPPTKTTFPSSSVPVQQVMGEWQESGLFSDVAPGGTPPAASAANPTIKVAGQAFATGAQPSGTTQNSGANWSTKSNV